MSRVEMMEKLKDCMDFSNYPKSHPLFSTKNQAVPGYFKDENAGNYMIEVVGLKAKCYTTKVIEKNTNRNIKHVVCKGIGKKARESLSM